MERHFLHEGPIPWQELRVMSDMDQDAWWQRNLTSTAAALIDRRMRESGNSFTDCVLILFFEQFELAKELIEARRKRREAESNQEETSQ